MRALEVYKTSKGEITRAFYADLCKLGPVGKVAMNLFRAQKASARAKKYRGGIRGVGSFSSLAYEKKGWSLEQLSLILCEHGALLGISFGWKYHGEAEYGPKWVIYVDLPQGQVSFHSYGRYSGPDYPGEFDGAHKSEERIILFCEEVLNGCRERDVSPGQAADGKASSESASGARPDDVEASALQ